MTGQCWLLLVVVAMSVPRLDDLWHINSASRATMLASAMTTPGVDWQCRSGPPDREVGTPLAAAPGTTPRDEWRLGQAAAARGDCREAIRHWSLAVSVPNDRQNISWFGLGGTHYALGERLPAVEAFRKAGAGPYVINLARQNLTLGNVAKSIEYYELALDIGASLDEVEALADLYSGQSQGARATALWQRVVDSAPQADPVHWRAQAAVAQLQGQWDDAREALERALALTPTPEQYGLWLRLGRVDVQRKAWEDVIAAYARAAELKPADSSEPYSAAGVAAGRLSRYDEAMHWFNRGLTAVPGDPWPNVHAGNTAVANNDPTEAERRYRAALRQMPDHYGALYALGAFLSSQHREDEAIRHLERIAGAGNCDVLRILVQNYRSTGRQADAQRTAAQTDRYCQ